MLPSIKNVGAKVFGIMGDSGSTLARYSDIIIATILLDFFNIEGVL